MYKLNIYYAALGSFIRERVYQETKTLLSYEEVDAISQLAMIKLKMSLDETIEIIKINKEISQ